MNDLDVEFKIWACEAIIAMARIGLNESDPNAVVEDWFDEAAEGDEPWLLWAMGMWSTMRTFNSFQLEGAQALAREELAELGRQEPKASAAHNEFPF